MRSFWLSSSWVLCAWRCFFFAAESALALLLEPQAGANNSLGVGLVFSWCRRRRRFFSLLFKPAGGGEWLSIRSWTDLGLEVRFFGGRTVESGVHRPSADGLLWSCCCICGDLVRFSINADVHELHVLYHLPSIRRSFWTSGEPTHHITF